MRKGKLQAWRQAVLTLAIILGTASTCLGGEPTPFFKKFYDSIQSNIREEYDVAQRLVETERLRKAQAGEPPLTSDQVKLGFEGVRSILYHKAVSMALCYEQSGTVNKDLHERENKFKECISVKLAQLAEQSLKLSKLGEYLTSIGKQKYQRCEMKARDFENESRLPPYDFLQNSDGPKLLDFGLMNECLLAGL